MTFSPKTIEVGPKICCTPKVKVSVVDRVKYLRHHHKIAHNKKNTEPQHFTGATMDIELKLCLL